MKRKYLEIIVEDTCANCPYCHWDYDDYAFTCRHPVFVKKRMTTGEMMVIDVSLDDMKFSPILKECPLPDEEGE